MIDHAPPITDSPGDQIVRLTSLVNRAKDVLGHLNGFSAFDLSGSECHEDFVTVKRQASELLAALQPNYVPTRQDEIQEELRLLGYRMEPSLSSLDDDAGAHAVITLPRGANAGGDLVDDAEVSANPRLLALAVEWSELENATAGETVTLARPEQAGA